MLYKRVDSLFVNLNRDKDNSLCAIRNIESGSFFLLFPPASCLIYNKSVPLIYCNSTVTIDLAGSLIFITSLSIFISLRGTNFTLSGFSKEL